MDPGRKHKWCGRPNSWNFLRITTAPWKFRGTEKSRLTHPHIWRLNIGKNKNKLNRQSTIIWCFGKSYVFIDAFQEYWIFYKKHWKDTLWLPSELMSWITETNPAVIASSFPGTLHIQMLLVWNIVCRD